jgi:hypothetical protein
MPSFSCFQSICGPNKKSVLFSESSLSPSLTRRLAVWDLPLEEAAHLPPPSGYRHELEV